MENRKVAVVMGSQSDWDTMQHACVALDELGVLYSTRIISAHRTPDLLFQFAANASVDGFQVIIAGAGGAAHLPGMLAAKTHLPVFGVPVPSANLQGMDSLLSIVQMPKGIPVGALAIGKGGAFNAGLLACSVLALSDEPLRRKLVEFRKSQTESVLLNSDPRK